MSINFFSDTLTKQLKFINVKITTPSRSLFSFVLNFNLFYISLGSFKNCSIFICVLLKIVLIYSELDILDFSNKKFLTF